MPISTFPKFGGIEILRFQQDALGTIEARVKLNDDHNPDKQILSPFADGADEFTMRIENRAFGITLEPDGAPCPISIGSGIDTEFGNSFVLQSDRLHHEAGVALITSKPTTFTPSQQSQWTDSILVAIANALPKDDQSEMGQVIRQRAGLIELMRQFGQP